jgi:hypothetical protein
MWSFSSRRSSNSMNLSQKGCARKSWPQLSAPRSKSLDYQVRKLTQMTGAGGGERKVEANMLQKRAHLLEWQSWLHEGNVWAAAVRMKAGSSRNQSRRVEVLM